MRDALSLTDQAIAYGEGKLTGADVAEMLGTVDRGRVLDVVSAILDEDPAAVLSLVAQIAEHAPDFVSTLDELSNILHQMTIAQTVPEALDTSWPDQARVAELAARATIDDTQLFWQMAVGGRREVHLASSARAGLEMILLRMIAFRPASIIQSQPAAGDPPAKKPKPPATPVAASGEREATQTDSSAAKTPSSATPVVTPEGVRPTGVSDEKRAEEPTSDQSKEEAVAPQLIALEVLRTETWPTEFERFQFSGILHNIALNLELTEVADATLRFSLAERDATLLNDRHPLQLAQALQQQLGEAVTAEIVVAEHGGCTPASHRAAMAAARLADAEQAISSDDALRKLMEAFDGQIIPGSIRPNLADGEPEGHGVDAEGRL